MENTQDFKKWELKVAVHCEGCARKVKRLLQSIHGVYRVSVDSATSKVTVEGESKLNSDVLIEKLKKTGKPAELWAGHPKYKPSDDDKKTYSKVGGGKEKKKKKTEDAGKQDDRKKTDGEKDDGCSKGTSASGSSNGEDDVREANGDVRQDLSHRRPPQSVIMYNPASSSAMAPYTVHCQVQAVDPCAVVYPYGPTQSLDLAQMPRNAYSVYPPADLRFDTDIFNDENTNSCTLM